MAVNAKTLEKPFLTLRKSLKKASGQPSPKEVHDLRTRARRVEAALHALLLDQRRKGRKILKEITPVRKRAGKARDMDVLIRLVSSLDVPSDDDCRLRLIGYLSRRRFAGARKLHSVIRKRRNSAANHLRRCSRAIRRNHSNKKEQQQWAADAAAISLQLSEEIRNWPKLTTKNLHQFRLKVKSCATFWSFQAIRTLVKALGNVKNKIGDWHNWVELSAVARDTLSHRESCAVLKQIRSRTQKYLREGIAEANRMRMRYFHPRPTRTNPSARAIPTSESVWKAAAKLAA